MVIIQERRYSVKDLHFNNVRSRQADLASQIYIPPSKHHFMFTQHLTPRSMIIGLIMILFSNQSIAQSIADRDSLPAVFVSGRLPGNVLNQPYTATILDSASLMQKMPRSTPESLQGEAGVFVQKTNHGGGSPFIRGLTGNQTLLLLDGIRINNSIFRYGPNQYFNTIDPYTIGKLEILKGAGSVQYGSDALGGVIHVRSRQAQLADKAYVQGTGFGRFINQKMEQSWRAEIAAGNNKAAFLGGYSHKHFGDLIGGDTTGRQTPSGYGEQSFDAQIKLQIAEGWKLRIVHQSVLQKDVPVYHKVVLEKFAYNKMDPQRRHLTYLTLSRNFNRETLQSAELTVAAQNSFERRKSQKLGKAAFTHEEDNIYTYSVSIDVQHRFREWWTSNSGAEIYLDKISSAKTNFDTVGAIGVSARGLYPDASRYNNFSVFTLHHFNIENFQFEAGLRYNSLQALIPTKDLGEVKISPAAMVGNLGVMYNLTPRMRAYAHVSSGFRAPNIDDLGTLGVVDFRYEKPAYGLNPEKTYHYEMGLRHFDKKLQAHAAVYYMDMRSIIARIKQTEKINGYDVYLKENVEKGYIMGVEFSANYHLTDALSIDANYAAQKGWSISKAEPMRRIPPAFGAAGIKFKNNGMYASLETLGSAKQNKLAAGDKSDNRIPAGGTPGWFITNVYAGYSLKFADFSMSLQNIFNKDYRIHGSGINGMGRSLILSIRTSLSKCDK